MLINRQLGDYLLVRRLAVGGQSEVFLAIKQGPDTFSRPLVLKAMPTKYREDARFLRLFYQEAFISARFSHPNLISVHDAKRVGDEHFMVMDFVSGQTVSDLAQRSYQTDKPLTINQVVQIVADACAGLHYAHEFVDVDERTFSIIHCDVSPQNLMVTYDGWVKVFDFGIARVVGGDDEEAPSIGGGKYAYMSPEQCRGDAVDARSDIFSLGIILFELCTGYRLFRRPTRPEVIMAVMEDEIPRPCDLSPDIPVFLERCILKALQRDPAERYQTARELRDDLLEFVLINGGVNVHDELGQHVRELFGNERAQIADILRQAAAMESPSSPLGGVALAELSPGWRRQADSSMEMEVSMLELLPASDENKALPDSFESDLQSLESSREHGLLEGTDGDVEAILLAGNHGVTTASGPRVEESSLKSIADDVEEDFDDFDEPAEDETAHEAAFQAEYVKITGRSARTADFVETVELSRDSAKNTDKNNAADDYIEMIVSELERSRKRQRWLLIAVICLLIIAGSLGALAYTGQLSVMFEAATPIQLGTEL